MILRTNLSVLHIGAGRYRPKDRQHVTYGIWRELARGFHSYHVIGRSAAGPADWSDGNLRVTLLASRAAREAEFLVTQFRAVPFGLRDKPDVILCQSPVLGGLAALMIARLTGARILMELHGMEYFAPARFGSRLWLLQQLSRFALGRADLTRVLSPRMGEQLARTYGVGLAPRTRILPPRVDISGFSRGSRRRTAGDPLRLVMVGAVNENKGQLRLIRALSDIAFPVELHVVGEGPDLPGVNREADDRRREGSSLRIVAHGALPHAGVADVLRSCDLFIMYSRTEATPRAMMEAMAVGLPIITTDVGFCADVVQHGIEGFVLGPDPDHEIIGVLDRLHSDPALAGQLGAAARARAELHFESVRLFEEYRQLIAETAGR